MLTTGPANLSMYVVQRIEKSDIVISGIKGKLKKKWKMEEEEKKKKNNEIPDHSHSKP